jgi:glutathione synthase/RimK-type ligase-like ATP-grasp enzyme
VFCRDGITPPDGINNIAIQAVRALGYNLGAVDIAFNVKKNQLVVLEVNANPGMQGATLENYAAAIVSNIKGIK